MHALCVMEGVCVCVREMGRGVCECICACVVDGWCVYPPCLACRQAAGSSPEGALVRGTGESTAASVTGAG